MTLRQLDFKYAYGFADRVVGAVYSIPEEELHVHNHLDGDDDSFLTKISKPCKE